MPYTPTPLPTYTFKNGAVAHVHHIGMMTIGHISAAMTKKITASDPIAIPTMTVDMGDGPTEQPNPAAPEYQAALTARQQRINLAIMDALLDLAVDIQVDEDALGHVQGVLERVGIPLDEVSPKVAYIKHCCITGGEELGKLSSLIRGDLEEATEAVTATFSSDLPEQAAVTLESAPIRSALLA